MKFCKKEFWLYTRFWRSAGRKRKVIVAQEPGSTLIFNCLPQSWKISSTSGYDHVGYQAHLWHQGWPCPPSLLSETLNVLQKPPLRTEDSWHTFNQARMLKFCTLVGNLISRTIVRSKITHVHVSGHEPSSLNVLLVTGDDRVVSDTILIMPESWNLAHKLGIT